MTVHTVIFWKNDAGKGSRGKPAIKSPPPDLQRVGGAAVIAVCNRAQSEDMGCALKASRCPTACRHQHGARGPFVLTLSDRAVTIKNARAARRAVRRLNFALLLKVRVLARSRASACQTARRRFACIAMHGRRIHPRDSGRFSGSKPYERARWGQKRAEGRSGGVDNGCYGKSG